MKKILLCILASLLLQHSGAQVPDSVVKKFSTYLCNCTDTLNYGRTDAELKKAFNLCKSIALAQLLNEHVIGPEFMSDNNKMQKLGVNSAMYMTKHCTNFSKLLDAVTRPPAFKESNADNIFIPAAFFSSYGLEAGETNTRLHVYNNKAAGAPQYQRIVDIRWTFDSEADALQWHEQMMMENAEGGVPINDMIVIEGAKELKVFREGKGMASSMKAMGIAQRHHYFLFVHKNIVCKIFIATDENTSSMQLVPFAVAAVKQLNAVSGGKLIE
jgi:hypothetical protein